jgi:hypothetical protein
VLLGNSREKDKEVHGYGKCNFKKYHRKEGRNSNVHVILTDGKVGGEYKKGGKIEMILARLENMKAIKKGRKG